FVPLSLRLTCARQPTYPRRKRRPWQRLYLLPASKRRLWRRGGPSQDRRERLLGLPKENCRSKTRFSFSPWYSGVLTEPPRIIKGLLPSFTRRLWPGKRQPPRPNFRR